MHMLVKLEIKSKIYGVLSPSKDGHFEILGKIPGYQAVGYNDAGEALFDYGSDDGDS